MPKEKTIYFLQEAMETFTEEVTAKQKPSNKQSRSLGKDSEAEPEDNYFSMTTYHHALHPPESFRILLRITILLLYHNASRP